jgi:hypothetical protein
VDAAQARMMDAGAREQQQEATAPESASEVLRGAAGSSAAGGASNRADPAAAKSTLRAVVDSVALADRRAAREAWKRHEEQAEQVERAAACEELAQHAQHAARRAVDRHRASHRADATGPIWSARWHSSRRRRPACTRLCTLHACGLCMRIVSDTGVCRGEWDRPPCRDVSAYWRGA